MHTSSVDLQYQEYDKELCNLLDGMFSFVLLDESVTPPQARLELTSRAAEIQDLVVIAFVVLEKNKRVPHKRHGEDKGWVFFGLFQAL